MKRILKRAASLALASTLVLGAVPAMAAESPTTAKEDSFVAKKVKRLVYRYNTTTKGTATSFKVIKSRRKTLKVAPIIDYVKYKGKKYKVTKVGKNTFKGCKKLRKIKYRPTKALKFAKGAFNGVNTKKITFVVNKKMKAKTFKILKKRLRKAGFKGIIKKGNVK